MADRLLEHHPRRRRDQTLPAKRIADRPEQGGSAGQVEHPDVDRRGRQHVGDGRVVAGLGQVDADEPQPGQEAVDGFAVEQLGGNEPAQFSLDFVAVAGLIEARPRDGDDSGVGGQLAVPVTQVKRGQQLANSEVAGAPEDHEVASVNPVGDRHLVLLAFVFCGQQTQEAPFPGVSGACASARAERSWTTLEGLWHVCKRT